ncbi:MAG: hypothetical protein R3F29_12250 [Planctomycetota bacterium]
MPCPPLRAAVALTLQCSALLGAVCAQSTLVVGPGGFAQIRDAVAVAAPGDVVVVQPGVYAHFTAQVACTIRAAVPGTVEVAVDPAFVSCSGFGCWFAGVTVLAPPAGTSMNVIGLRFRPDLVTVGGQFVYPGVAVQHGKVVFEDCAFAVQGSSTLITGLYIDHTTAHLLRCTIEGSPFASISHTMRAVGADLTMVDTSVRTSAGSLGGSGAALDLDGSRLHGSGITLEGIGGPALRCANSTVWLADSSISSQQSASCVVQLLGGAAPQLDRCTVTNPPGITCATYPAATFLLGVQQTQPLQNGVALPLQLTTEANGLVGVIVGFGDGVSNVPGLLDQPLWLDPATAFVAAIAVADPLGHATVPIAIPAGVQFVDRRLALQGIGGAMLPLQLSPRVGGVVR